MVDRQKLELVAQNESVDYDSLLNLDTQIDRLFRPDRSVIYDAVTLTGLWRVSLNRREGDVDFVDFTHENSISLKEITSRQLIINRASVGIGARTIRATTETKSVLVSDDPDKNESLGPKIRSNEITGLNVVAVSELLIVNPELLNYYPNPRSITSVRRIVAGATEILESI